MFPILLLFIQSCSARTVTTNEVQPDLRDLVRPVWLNGPTYSAKIGGNWPSFTPGTISKSSTECLHNDKYTGYKDNGDYCEKGSTALDDNAHLLIYSGRVGIVLDAAGLSNSNVALRNLFPKIGSVPAISSASKVTHTHTEVFNALPTATTDISLTTTCSNNVITKYTLGTSEAKFVKVGLVRQGHAVTQLTVSALQFENSAGTMYGPCSAFTPAIDPDPTQNNPDPIVSGQSGPSFPRNNPKGNCNQDYGGGASWPCGADYPKVGLICSFNPNTSGY